MLEKPTSFIIHVGIDEQRGNAIFRGWRVIQQSNCVDFLTIGAGYRELSRLLESVIERLYPSFDVLAVALGLLKDEVHRGLEAGKTEGAVPAILTSDFVQ